MDQDLKNLQQLLDRIENNVRAESTRVSLGTVLEAVGSRSFGPMLLILGLILFSPLSGIPGIPTSMGVFVLLIAVQLLMGRKEFWLPDRLLRRSLPRKKLDRTLRTLRPMARRIDRFLRPRLPFLIRGAGIRLIAVTCLMISAGVPFMEVVLFSASSAGMVFVLFGLALIARDGLLALLGFVFTGATFGLIIHAVF